MSGSSVEAVLRMAQNYRSTWVLIDSRRALQAARYLSAAQSLSDRLPARTVLAIAERFCHYVDLRLTQVVIEEELQLLPYAIGVEPKSVFSFDHSHEVANPAEQHDSTFITVLKLFDLIERHALKMREPSALFEIMTRLFEDGTERFILLRNKTTPVSGAEAFQEIRALCKSEASSYYLDALDPDEEEEHKSRLVWMCEHVEQQLLNLRLRRFPRPLTEGESAVLFLPHEYFFRAEREAQLDNPLHQRHAALATGILRLIYCEEGAESEVLEQIRSRLQWIQASRRERENVFEMSGSPAVLLSDVRRLIEIGDWIEAAFEKHQRFLPEMLHTFKGL